MVPGSCGYASRCLRNLCLLLFGSGGFMNGGRRRGGVCGPSAFRPLVRSERPDQGESSA